MSQLKMGSPERALELASSAKPELTQRSFVTTMDYRMVDGANNRALASLREALAGANAPMATWKGELRHAAKPENIKRFYPPEQQGAWVEPIELRLAVFEDSSSGRAVWLVEAPSKDGSAPRLSLWLSEPGSAEWQYYRSLEIAPEGMSYLSQLADPDFVRGEFARIERAQLDKTASRGAPAGPAPRV